MKTFAIAAAIAAMGVASQAHALGTPIYIDPNGSIDGVNAIEVTSLNWLAGNVLTQGALGVAGESAAAVGGTRFLTTDYQAQLNTFVNNTGGGSVATLPTIGTQWTVVASITESVTGIGTGTVALVPISGTVSVYFNPTVIANDISGTGYVGATKILQGTIVAGSGNFTDFTRLIPALFPTQILDNFGTNNLPTVGSHSGSGQSTIKVDIGATAGDFFDPNFFLSNIASFDFLLSGLEDINDAGQLVAPFAQANPSLLVNGVAPSYSPGNATFTGGINGGDCAVDANGNFTQRCDFQFQTTNVTSFNAIPEPGSLAIVGLGMGLLGIFGRRRKVA